MNTNSKFPFPYKLAIFKREQPARFTWSGCDVKIFDSPEDPLPPKEYGYNFIHLREFCTEALDRVDIILGELNDNEMVEKLRYTWVIHSVHLDLSNDPHKQFIIVFVLKDSSEAFEAMFGKVGGDNTCNGWDESRTWASTPSTLPCSPTEEKE
ncbi:hypothetical protein ABW20_dc0108661 [Dactylellina cionopaga]|nr:hypothetical protein ABW20_dc0108661 [Dactylellina cionopaga]